MKLLKYMACKRVLEGKQDDTNKNISRWMTEDWKTHQKPKAEENVKFQPILEELLQRLVINA
jgi:hypothetical protein